jgi:uncharacterized membrane protein
MNQVPPAAASKSGTLYALMAYGLWGLLPIYWKALHGVPLGEALAHRVLWSLATILILLAATGNLGNFRATLSDPRKRALLLVSALLIGANWSIYILAVYRGELVQASLGYYTNPLMSVGLGMALGERLTRVQIVAVVLAAIGVVLLAMQLKGLPWVALGLALSFAFYGFVKNRTRHRDAVADADSRRLPGFHGNGTRAPGFPDGGETDGAAHRYRRGYPGSAVLLQRGGQAPALVLAGVFPVPEPDHPIADGGPLVP